ncbi:rRNA N6-adenosine-methyltransferase METTL5-like [Hibiscus syriacus]|uniref:rRNA N6-adenosine-methyltransferase METTL5-like n=1 Tax=Hibiscus syriacus TaxID=106335 RepID=UPI001922A29F|nr:rRNA N6-adenosine-methyltransferase METTL5-like [Hibiscus syriacus]
MKPKQLESLLGDLQQFSNPEVELEQYPTGPHIASRLLYTERTFFFLFLGLHFLVLLASWVLRFSFCLFVFGVFFKAENSFDDISNKVVADFGCGCGTLAAAAAAALLGAKQVIGIDIDSQSLEIASTNAEDLELDMDFIQCDISNLGWRGQIVDTVVMNPPFGTRKKGIDMDFLFVAVKVQLL